jgi:alanyl-tRNA synthetase
MDSNEIRRRFLGFFDERSHRVVPSSSLISPVPGLLLTNAGMNQFVPYFMGVEEPPYPRATTCQKVFRTGDIELVGHDARHLTFFEMLGNFSFGDYFKREAIRWAHELVTEGFGIDHDRLWATVYESDDEAIGLWIEEAGLPPERIVRRGKADNFWWTHTAGPCGPCSEIYVDRGPEYGADGGPDVDEDRFLEIWNLVFMQNECDEHANVLADLPKKNIDTGSSLERVALVMQGVDTVFETDLFRPLVETAERLTGRRYGEDAADDVHLRVMAEHGRATTFLVADGVLPSNEGRGYVLRRMLRRLVTYARRLGVDRPVMGDLVGTTVSLMGGAYPELVANMAFILQVLSSEEERFAGTLRQGLAVFEHATAETERSEGRTLTGEAAFKLHDTFGFPLELTVELAAEAGLGVDTDGFARQMEEQRDRARAAQKKGDPAEGVLGELAGVVGPTEFVGYERLRDEGRVVGMVSGDTVAEAAGEGAAVRLLLDRSPFYAEGGGQIGDAGTIRTSSGVVEVTDTRPGLGGTIVHRGRVVSGEVRQGDAAEAEVDRERRAATARSHTGTHVLHHQIRLTLGEHARQAGSLVAPGRLRFDFTHYEAVPKDALEEIEYLVNRRLADDQPVRAYETTYDFARSEGAIALFGEKYGDLVRVVEVGDYSVELCGGTHVRHTGEVALIRLVSEASIGSGFRRVEAVTGPDALRQINLERRLLEEVVDAVGGGDPNGAPERVRQAVARIKSLESELGILRRGERDVEVERLAGRAVDVAGVALVVSRLDGTPAGELREVALALKDRLEPRSLGAVVLGAAADRKAVLVGSCTGELVARGVTAPALLESAAKAIGGNAGGRPTIASGGGPNGGGLDAALALIPARLADLLQAA